MVLQTAKERFYTNFKYTLSSKRTSPRQIASLEVNQYENFNSLCNETMVGVVQDLSLSASLKCFYGYKISETSFMKSSQEVTEDINQKIVFYDQGKSTFDSQVRARARTILAQVKYEDMQDIVDYVNNNKFTWKAQISERFSGLTLEQLKDKRINPNFAQVSSLNKILAQTNSISDEQIEDARLLQDSDFLETLDEARSFTKYELNDLEESNLPKSWDWRDVNGYNFMPAVDDQKGCGSCYTFSFISSLEARIKILTGKTRKLSPQFMIDCNYLTEGCDGGWPLLNGFFASDFSIPLASCAPYKAFTVGNKCSDHSECPGAVKVESSGYIGGSYGGSNEILMMKEIRARGPIVSDLNVPLSFSYYTEGIFSDEHEK